MPTLGIEMTDREPINGWESIIIKPMPRLVAAYNAAKNDADDAWDLYYQSVDQWEDTRTRFPNDRAKIKWATELMSEALTKAEEADKKFNLAYKQMECPHNHRAVAGGEITAYDGEATDSGYEYCLDCGARL